MKAILIIDIPNDTYEAYTDMYVDYDLRGTPKEDTSVSESIKYVEEAPLKPMPEKNVWDKKDFADGWNACIDKLKGETE